MTYAQWVLLFLTCLYAASAMLTRPGREREPERLTHLWLYLICSLITAAALWSTL